MTVRTIDDIFCDFVIDGVPAYVPFTPYTPDIRDMLKKLPEGLSKFPDNRVIRLINANTRTANNIAVSASVAIPPAAYQVLYILNVSQPLAAGHIVPGMTVLCVDTGRTLRMLSYGEVDSVVEDILVFAEAAKVAAELARDEAQDAVSQCNVTIYSTRNAVEVLVIPAGLGVFRTNGFATVGDGGAALYKRVTFEPTHAGKVRSEYGAWSELVAENGELDFAAFGGVDDGEADNSDA